MSDSAPLHRPWDVDIEGALLGSLLRDNALIDVAAAEIEAGHFYDALHGRIYASIVEMSAVGAVTPILLKTRLRTDPAWDDLEGGDGYLDDLWAAAPAAPNVKDYCRWVKEYAARRELQSIATDLADSVYSPPAEAPARAIADQAMERLLSLGRAEQPSVTPYEAAMASLRQIEAARANKHPPGLPTGLTKLDDEIGRLRGGDLCVVMASSGMGKSSVLASFALQAAMRQYPTIFFSLEMTQQQVVERMLCDIDFDTADKPMWYSRFRNATLSESEFGRAGAAAQIIGDLPLEIHDTDDLTIQQIGSRARAFAAKHPGRIGLVLIDYVQIIVPAGRKDGTREQEVAGNTRGAKSLAKRLNWPVVAGSQINDGPQVAPGKERPPRLSDARESKAIIMEADIVLSPWREAYYVARQKPRGMEATADNINAWQADMRQCEHKMDLLGLKNRHGRTFEIECYVDMGASVIRDESPMRSILTNAEEMRFL